MILVPGKKPKPQAAKKNSDPFPYSLFMLYVVYWMAQPFYQNFIGVYQRNIGMSLTMIGMLGAAIALVMMFIKPMIGALTDKAQNKNRVVSYLLLITAVSVLFFYIDYLLPPRSNLLFIWVSVCMLLYQTFYTTATTLLEANGVEMLGERSKRWHNGHIRLGGTIGFMIAALFSNWFIAGNHFERIFVTVSFFCVVSAIWIWRLPVVAGKARKTEKVPYAEIFKNRPFLVMLFLQLTNSVGMVFFRYYGIYLTDTSINAFGRPNGLGFDSGFVGLLAFFNAALEIPIFWYAGKIRDKIGMRLFMTIAVMINAVKNILFSYLTSQPIILLVTMITGFSFVGIHFCTEFQKNRQCPAVNINKLMRVIDKNHSSLCIGKKIGNIVILHCFKRTGIYDSHIFGYHAVL